MIPMYLRPIQVPNGALIKTQRIIMIFFLHTERMVNMVNNINVNINILIGINFIIYMISFHASTWFSSIKKGVDNTS